MGFFPSRSTCKTRFFFFSWSIFLPRGTSDLIRPIEGCPADSSPFFAQRHPTSLMARLKSHQALRTCHTCAMVKNQTENPVLSPLGQGVTSGWLLGSGLLCNKTKHSALTEARCGDYILNRRMWMPPLAGDRSENKKSLQSTTLFGVKYYSAF